MNYFFVALLLACTAYALVAGGGPERIGAATYALACTATYLLISARPGPWQNVEFGVLVIDVATFAGFCILALRAERFWPVWVSALLGLGVFGHLGRWVEPGISRWAYAVALTIWSYPILAILAVGTWAHRRRVAQFGADKSWSSIRPGLASSRWYTKYRILPRRQKRRQLGTD